MIKRRPMQVRIECIPSQGANNGIGWLLGWRWHWQVLDWFDEGEVHELREEPVRAGWYKSLQGWPLSLAGGTAAGDARSREKAITAGNNWIAWVRKEQEQEDRREIKRRASIEYH